MVNISRNMPTLRFVTWSRTYAAAAPLEVAITDTVLTAMARLMSSPARVSAGIRTTPPPMPAMAPTRPATKESRRRGSRVTRIRSATEAPHNGLAPKKKAGAAAMAAPATPGQEGGCPDACQRAASAAKRAPPSDGRTSNSKGLPSAVFRTSVRSASTDPTG
jgi:hypothetical protein